MPHYPQNVNQVIDLNAKYKPAVLAAVRRFAKSKPYRGTLVERQAKIATLNCELALAYGVEPPTLIFDTDGTGNSGMSNYCPSTRTITLHGKLSVITLLHEWAHYKFGGDEYQACRWSLNLFHRCFPISWERLQFEGHVARRLESL